MISKPVVLTGLLACSAILFLTGFGLPTGHSVLFNYAWYTQYSEALSWGNPLPRYLPGLWSGFGGYDFFFYAPLPFWLVAAVIQPLCAGCTPSAEFVLGSAILWVLSGFTMFAFLRSFVDAASARMGAVVYVLLPYHIVLDWFERQAAGEFTAYAFLPLAALGLERIRRDQDKGWLLSLGVAGSTLSHLPTTLLVAHVFGVLLLVFVVVHPAGAAGGLRLLARSAWFGLLGLALAAFYWVPAIFLLDTVSPAMLYSPYFEAWRWLFGLGWQQSLPEFALRVLAAFLACLPLLVLSLRVARGPVLAWIVVPVLLALVLNTALSEVIWREWILSRVQFPWRLMTVVDFSTAIAVAVLAARAADVAARFRLATGLAAGLLTGICLALTVPDGLWGPHEETFRDGYAAAEYLSPEMSRAVQQHLGKPELDHFDQSAIDRVIAAMAPEFRRTHGNGTLIEQRPRSLTVRAPQGAGVLSLSVQYWDIWRAVTASGTPLETRANRRFGTLDIIAPPGGFGTDPVIVSLPFQRSELAGGLASLAAALVLVVSGRRRPRPVRDATAPAS